MAVPTTVLAQTALFKPGQNGVSYKVNVPSSTSQSGKGPIYFQLQAPSSDQWIGLGQGTQMAGANIFIMYAASDSNVTLSPRSGKGEFQPLFNSQAQVTLIEGTGISNGVMTANVRCDNCLSWNGGSMDPTDPQSPWIWSVKHGSAIDSTSTSQNLVQHDIMGTFKFDLTKATGGSSQNPFSSGSPTASGASPSSTSDGDGDGDSDDDGSSSTGTSVSEDTIDKKRKAHAAVMTTSFAVLLPVAAMVLRLPVKNFRIVPLIHAPIQLLALCLIITGLGIGVSLAQNTNNISKPVQAHVVIGIIVVSTLVLFQPAMGLMQHLHFRKTGGKSVMAYTHRWLGRTMIVLGMINGGLGLRLAGIGTDDAPNSAVIAYSVVAGVIAITYIAVVLFTSARDIKGSRTTAGNGRGRPRGGEKYAMQNMTGQPDGDARRDVMSASGESDSRLMDGGNRYA